MNTDNFTYREIPSTNQLIWVLTIAICGIWICALNHDYKEAEACTERYRVLLKKEERKAEDLLRKYEPENAWRYR